MAARILVLSGSSREGSLNARLAAFAAQRLGALGHEATLISLGDYDLPMIDESWRKRVAEVGAAAELGRLVDDHGGIFVACPEYNSGYPPALKNAFDWISFARPGGPALAGKVVALGGCSPGARGAYRCLTQFRSTLELGFGALVLPEMVSVPHAGSAFDDKGGLADASQVALLDAALTRLAGLSAQLSPGWRTGGKVTRS